MSENFLAKEKEFRRLNRELGEKTKNMMEEIDSIMNSERKVYSPIIFEPFQPRLESALAEFHAEPPNHLEFDQLFPKTEGNCQNPDEILSPKRNHVKNDAVVRFLKAKIKMLMTELNTCKDEYKKKSNYSHELEIENKKISEARDKFFGQILPLKENISKLEENLSSIQSDLQARNAEKVSMEKEVDSLKKEIKILSQQASNIDLRLNRSLQENEKLKNTIKLCKVEEKELREQIKKTQESERQGIRNLERQISQMWQAFRKQMLLIDNLKKQKGLLEASLQMQLTRKDLSKILDWKPENSI